MNENDILLLVMIVMVFFLMLVTATLSRVIDKVNSDIDDLKKDQKTAFKRWYELRDYVDYYLFEHEEEI